MEITFDEAVEYLQDGESVTLTCDGYDYEISDAGDWVGGEEGQGFISLVLGNAIYSDPKRVIKESIDFLSKEGKEVSISI